MGIFTALTIVFIVLKLIGTIDWSWWLVLLPTIVSLSFYMFWVVLVGGVARAVFRDMR